jgi:predicted phosphodiesterase
MKKFLLLILGLFFSLSSTAFAENIKFAQVADVHLTAESSYSTKVLQDVVTDINNQEGISFVVFTGDNINNPKEENLKTFVKIVKKLKVPYYVALGNHDVYKSGGLSKVRYFEVLRENNLLFPQRKPNYVFKKNDFVFIIVDGAKEVVPGSVGYYRKDTLEWLDKELTKYSNKNVVIFQHFPVEYPEGVESSLKTHKTYKVEIYQELLTKHNNVLAVVSGHFHVNSENMKNGVYHIASPSLLTMPNSYKIIDIVTTKEFSPIIYTQLREFEAD